VTNLLLNKYAAKLNENQEKLNSKKLYNTISKVNLNLSNIHRSVAPKIDIQKFKYATDYVNQFISHTSVWNLKFLMNLENPEVAMLQIFHLEFIFLVENTPALAQEKAQFEKQAELFFSLGVYSDDHLEKRKIKMYTAIDEAIKKEDQPL